MILDTTEIFILDKMIEKEMRKKENESLSRVFNLMKKKLKQEYNTLKALKNFYQ